MVHPFAIQIDEYAGDPYTLTLSISQGATTHGPYALTESVFTAGLFEGTVAETITGSWSVEITATAANGSSAVIESHPDDGGPEFGPLPDPANVAGGYQYGPVGDPLVGTNLTIDAAAVPVVVVYGQRMPPVSMVATGVVVPGVGVGTGSGDSSTAGIERIRLDATVGGAHVHSVSGLEDMSGTTVTVVIEDQDGRDVETPVVTLAGGNQGISFMTQAANDRERVLLWSARRSDTGKVVARGDYVVTYAAEQD